ncbi:MAG: XdhC family protein [Gammaproteobacteria bacterium]|nr:XdhC family protein [Gammaproteobacteria bacterium]NND59009.1 XdhC family protein [Gammaproteobacteria bacterium]
MNLRQLITHFEQWRSQRRRLALAIVVATTGSTYTKPDALMLLDEEGQYCGLLSGGCLEPDLAAHAAEVIATATVKVVRYDMSERDDDELWGLGLGCDGTMSIMILPLSEDNDYQPLARVAQLLSSQQACRLLLDVSSTRPAWVGVASDDDDEAVANMHTPHEPYTVTIAPPLRLLVLGAGRDAAPVVAAAQRLGWHVTVADHRPVFLQQSAFQQADCRIDSNEPLPLDNIDAAVVMSHHLGRDRLYLRALANSSAPYIGLLGPPARRERLLADIDADDDLRNRVRGPVGLDIGARDPESIAVSIVAEIYRDCLGS